MKFNWILILLTFSCHVSRAQSKIDKSQKQIRPYVAIELGEAIFNSFQSASGEIGVDFDNNHSIRVVHMNVNLSESHLSSDFAAAVDGNEIEGSFFGFEAFYDFPVLLKGLRVGPSLGYYKNKYQHQRLDQSLDNESATIGLGLSYVEKDIFKVKGLYYRISVPLRMPLNPIKETMLGEATINSNKFDNNIWFFVGFQFR